MQNTCYKRHFMKAGLLAAALLPAALAPAHSQTEERAPSIRWISSTQGNPWQELSPPGISAQADVPAGTVSLDPQTRYQRIDGFGGCFNELGWDALQAGGDPAEQEALRALFDPNHGCGFSVGRMSIGANDFAREWYSLDETPGDLTMTHFSIDRDRQILIPYMKAAMQYQPKLKVWGVPWSPPSWMKTTGSYKGGRMKQDPPTLAAYALYFSKYVQAYRRAGINLYAVYPQNEPTYNNNIYPQCQWSGPELDTFLRDYLVPRLKADRVSVQVWCGTIVTDRLGEFVDPVLGDPATKPAITGIGYQYGGQSAFGVTHAKYPGKELRQTETECYNGENNWGEALNTFGHICDDLNNFANGYDYWNLILSEKGTSTWGWHQNSLITIDTQAKKVVYNPEFYALKHFSRYLPSGAYRIAVSGTQSSENPLPHLAAFRDSHGALVVVFSNTAATPVPLTLHSGASTAHLTVPARSMNTVLLSGW